MKCQILFYDKKNQYENKKNVKLSSAESTHRTVKVVCAKAGLVLHCSYKIKMRSPCIIMGKRICFFFILVVVVCVCVWGGGRG